MGQLSVQDDPDLDTILTTDEETRAFTRDYIRQQL